MQTSQVTVRRAGESDYDEWFALFAAVAAEGRWLGSELPLDQAAYRRRYLDALVDPDRPGIPFVAEAGGRHVGQLFLTNRAGIGDIGMAVDAAWRGQGVGSALLAAAVEWARAHDLHKLALQVWPHNVAAQRLYEKFGFVAEGRLRRQYRRRNGELWDAVVMGLVLDETSPGSPEPG
jgi:putative acetyltransferase